MRKLFILLVTTFICVSLSAQKRAVISKVTATWCSNCGSWGWDIAEELKSQYASNDSDGLLLGVHFSGDLQNATANWFADNLDQIGQPQFFVGNENASVNRNNWADRVADINDSATEFVNAESRANMSFVQPHFLDGDVFKIKIDVDAMEDPQNEFYLAVYVYENNVLNRQTNQTGEVEHPNVLREVIAVDPWGDRYLTPGFGGKPAQRVELEWPVDSNYDISQIGFLAVMYEKVGDTYVIDNSIASNSWDTVSSTDDESFSPEFSILQSNQDLMIETKDDQLYNLDILNQLGQSIFINTFSSKTTVDISDYNKGIYIVTLSNKAGRYSKQVYLK